MAPNPAAPCSCDKVRRDGVRQDPTAGSAGGAERGSDTGETGLRHLPGPAATDAQSVRVTGSTLTLGPTQASAPVTDRRLLTVSGSRLHHCHRCIRNTASRELAGAPGAARQEPPPRPSLLPVRRHRFSARSGTAPRSAWLLTCLALRRFRVLWQGTRALRSRGPTRTLGPAAEPRKCLAAAGALATDTEAPPVEASASRALTAAYTQHLLGLAVFGGATAKETLPFRHLSCET